MLANRFYSVLERTQAHPAVYLFYIRPYFRHGVVKSFTESVVISKCNNYEQRLRIPIASSWNQGFVFIHF